MKNMAQNIGHPKQTTFLDLFGMDKMKATLPIHWNQRKQMRGACWGQSQAAGLAEWGESLWIKTKRIPFLVVKNHRSYYVSFFFEMFNIPIVFFGLGVHRPSDSA